MKIMKVMMALIVIALISTPVYAFEMNVGFKAGGHIYENEALNDVEGMNDLSFSSPTLDQAVPPIEVEIGFPFLGSFETSLIAGTYSGDAETEELEMSTRTVYMMVQPKILSEGTMGEVIDLIPIDIPLVDLPALFQINPEKTVTVSSGLGVGMAWYSVFTEVGAEEWTDDEFVFCIAPSVGARWGMTEKIDLTIDYRYLIARGSDDFDAGGHLFLMGILATF